MSHYDPRLPDTGQVCCYGVANDGPGGCTCWETRHDVDKEARQAELRENIRIIHEEASSWMEADPAGNAAQALFQTADRLSRALVPLSDEEDD